MKNTDKNAHKMGVFFPYHQDSNHRVKLSHVMSVTFLLKWGKLFKIHFIDVRFFVHCVIPSALLFIGFEAVFLSANGGFIHETSFGMDKDDHSFSITCLCLGACGRACAGTGTSPF